MAVTLIGHEDLEKLRDDCKEMRNLAIIDMLNSTGMRVGELVKLDRMSPDNLSEINGPLDRKAFSGYT